MKKILTLLLLINAGLPMPARELTATKFEPIATSLSNVMQQYVPAGNAGAVVKVQLPVLGCQFEGDVLATSFRITEYWVIMKQGANTLAIQCPDKSSCTVSFDKFGVNGLQPNKVYLLDLQGWNNRPEAVATDSLSDASRQSIRHMRRIAAAVTGAGATAIGAFRNGIAPIKKGNKYAFIDKEGNLLTPFDFDSYVDEYYLTDTDGRVVSKNKSYGVVNSKGELTIDCIYQSVDLRGPYASCTNSVKFNKWGVPEVTDKTKYDIYIIETGECYKRNASLREKNDILYGTENQYPRAVNNKKFIDSNGKSCFKQKFQYVYPFFEGLACVKIKSGWIIIDTAGNTTGTLPEGSFPYSRTIGYLETGFHDGLLPVEKNNKVGYVDKTGNVVIPFIYNEGNNFSEGLAAVATGYPWLGDRKYSYIDKSGNVIIPPTDNIFSCTGFHNGVAVSELINTGISDGGPWPQILYDKNGVVLLQGATGSLKRFASDGADCFEYNLYPYEKLRSNGKSYYAYIDRNYNEVTTELLSAADIFYDEFTSVTSKEGYSGIIDRYGNIVWLSPYK